MILSSNKNCFNKNNTKITGEIYMKALITGASSGIGKEMAYILANGGYDLILVARRAERLQAIKDRITSGNSVQITCICCDLAKKEECFSLYEQVKRENIDILINNAGFGLAGEFSKTKLETELNMIDTNITAVHILTKLFLKDFIKRDSGHILNVASSAGFMPGPLLSTYYATKNYVLRLSEAIYQELKHNRSNVRISVLCPGPVDTEFDKVADVKFSIKGITPQYAAECAIKNMHKGKLLIIPSAKIKLGIFMRRFVSEKLLLKISYKIQKKKQ